MQKRAADTKNKLMTEGANLFARFGYDAASIRDICHAAKANSAAIHYYFGDKRGLYEAILKDSFRREAEMFPNPVWERASSPQTYLEDIVFAVISRMHRTRKEAWQAQLMRREMSFPSAPFRKFIDGIIEHDFALFLKALKTINPVASAVCLRRAVLCLIGQVGAYTHHPPGFLRLCFPNFSYTAEECRVIARSIVHFTVSGLKTPEGNKPV